MLSSAGADLDGQVAPLVVGAVVADRLAARAHTGDGHADSEPQLEPVRPKFGPDGAVVVNQGAGPAHRGVAAEKVGEFKLESGGGAVQAVRVALRVLRTMLSGENSPRVGVENFDEPAEVAALVIGGECDRHGDPGDGFLLAVLDVDRRRWGSGSR